MITFEEFRAAYYDDDTPEEEVRKEYKIYIQGMYGM